MGVQNAGFVIVVEVGGGGHGYLPYNNNNYPWGGVTAGPIGEGSRLR